ncbi:MAG TPA: hypothetical protein VMV83_16655 [Rectinemataceae bacterium]|nr:hypothetical protein [Rectinemataceae bacterium]
MTASGFVAAFSSAFPLKILLAILTIDLIKGGALVLFAFILSRVWLQRDPRRDRALWALCLLALLVLPPLWL